MTLLIGLAWLYVVACAVLAVVLAVRAVRRIAHLCGRDLSIPTIEHIPSRQYYERDIERWRRSLRITDEDIREIERTGRLEVGGGEP